MLEYKCYISRDKPNLWSKWYFQQSEEVQGKHDTAFEFLEQRKDWNLPHFNKLSGRGGIGEVRLSGKVAWRIMGFRNTVDGIQFFIVVDNGFHKDNNYNPRKPIDEAHKRIEAVKNDPRKAESCKRPKVN